MAHLKAFATWIHSLQPFPLGHPMAKIKLPAIGSSLQSERALTPPERWRLLDAADQLRLTGGRSKDRKRYRTGQRPMRKGYRPYRNRVIIYTLIETGMRQAALTNLNIDDLDPQRRTLRVEEKGGYRHTYPISPRDGRRLKIIWSTNVTRIRPIDHLSRSFCPPQRWPIARVVSPCSPSTRSGKASVEALRLRAKHPTVLDMPWVSILWRKRAVSRRSSANSASVMPPISCSMLG